MNILIPTILILGSLGGILYFVIKKMPYLKKLSAESKDEVSFWEDLSPAIYSRVKQINIEEYKKTFINEFEKFIRMVRIVSLRIDNFTNKLLRKIKSKNGSMEKEGGAVTGELEIKTEGKELPAEESLSDLKKEEQRLIIEIAKDPKNAKLYKDLGDLYVKTNNTKDAKESFAVALELDPGDDVIREKLEKISKHLEE